VSLVEFGEGLVIARFGDQVRIGYTDH
jgi:hypothetical protein